MRGGLRIARISFFDIRSIPAYAGGTLLCFSIECVIMVDPRVCGGDFCMSEKFSAIAGRSPRMRGGPKDERDEIAKMGSIPAYAGGTTYAQSGVGCCKVDPRVCGGDRNGIEPWAVSWGRSPRMRGGLMRVGTGSATRRSIPAYAGGTLTLMSWETDGEVDPRVCGGDTFEVGSRTSGKGRSPRMRGGLPVQSRVYLSTGSIPAYAGGT